MKNIFEDPLETFTTDEVLAILQDIADEALRLEFKRQHIENATLAQIACSMANADGGIIAIGFNERNARNNVEFGQANPVDISNAKRTSLGNVINSLAFPPIPLTIWGYQTGGPEQGFLLIRIARSHFAPHEMLRQNILPNLPIRRDTSMFPLTLAEIDALRARREGIPTESPLKNKAWRRVTLTPDAVEPDFYFGVSIAPSIYRTEPRAMAIEDDMLCRQIEEATRGQGRSVHPALSNDVCEAYGLWLHDGIPPGQPAGRPARPVRQILVESDGEMVFRFRQLVGDPLRQYIALLLTAYAFTQEIFWNFQLAPRARVHLFMTLNAERLAHQTPLPGGHEDWFEMDLTLPFSRVFTPTTMVMWRRENQPTQRAAIEGVLDQFVQTMLPAVTDMPNRWAT